MSRWTAAAALLGLSCSLVSRFTAPTQAPPSPTASAPGASPTPPGVLPPADVPPTPIVDWSEAGPQREALLESFASDAAAFPAASRYWIEAEVSLDPQQTRASIEGTERILFTNPLTQPLQDLVLMLWPNDAQYASVMTAGPAVIDGVVVAPVSEAHGLGMRFSLPAALPAGGSLDLTLPFRVEASGPILPEAPKRFGFASGTFIAPTFYPIVPRLSPEGSWQTQIAPPGGDTTNSDIAFYDVRLTLPAEVRVVATGTEIDRAEAADGRVQVHFASGPVRDFAFAVGPLTPAEEGAGDVLVRASVLEEHAQAARATARVAARAVVVFEGLLGPYPYDELDVVDSPGAFGGIEYPGLVFIGVVGEPGDDLVIVHEVAHQWFYALIGNDQLREPWLDEAAASYAEVLYLEAIGEPQAALALLDQFRLILRAAGDIQTPIGRPITGYASESDYGVFVYLKGALFFDALRSRLGEAGFRDFLRKYSQGHRYGFATAASFQETAEEVCDCDLNDLFDLWVLKGGDLKLP